MPKDVPSDGELELPSDGLSSHPEPVFGEYAWSREFSYRKDDAPHKGGSTYALMLQGNQASYVKVNHAFVLGKRRKKDMMAVPIPRKVW